jgi:hypothetical protein
MPWESIKSNDGIYLVNWEGITRIIRSYARGRATKRFSKEVAFEKHWVGPDLYSVEVDWGRVRNETAVQTGMELSKIHAGAQRSMQAELYRLVYMIETADKDHDNLREMMRAAQDKTMKNVERSVHIGEIGVGASTFVRDASAETIMVGATYLSGGAALAAIGGGSVMKGAFAYQDTGKVGNAVGTFSTNLLLGVADIKVGAAITKNIASKSGKIGLLMVWAKAKGVLEVPKNLIEGKHLNEAASSGLVKTAAATPVTVGVEQLKDYLKSGGLPEEWAIPVDVALSIAQDKGGELLAKAGERAPESKRPPEHFVPVHRSHHLMDAVLYDRSIIEKSAVRKIGPGPRG